jgi:PAS domain S-box-containing protein
MSPGRQQAGDARTVGSRRGSTQPAEAPTAIVGVDGEILGWTAEAERLLGYRPGEVVGRSGTFLFKALEEPGRSARIIERCRTGPGWSGIVTARHRDGRPIELQLTVSAPFSMQGRGCLLVSARQAEPQWTLDPSMLDGFLTRSPIGMAVMSPELRYLWLNDTLERFGGVPREQRLGRRLSELMPGLQAESIEAVMHKVLETGIPVFDYEYQGWSWADPHRLHAYSTSFFPLLDADEQIAGVCYMVTDITDRWAAQQRLALVKDGSARLGSSLDVMRTAQELAELAVPRFADFVAVDLLESVFSGEPLPPMTAGGRPKMRRAGLQSVRPGCPEAIAKAGEPVEFIPPPHEADFLELGQGTLVADLDPTDPPWAIREPARAERIREFGLHSLISVPIRARYSLLGLATFARSQNLAPFENDDLLLARELVARAAVCLENARRYTLERTTALTLQRNLLPHTLAAGTTVETACAYLPANSRDGVGGDWFDVLPLSGARVALVVGDVVGHGINAAASMGRLRTAVHTLADMDLQPAEVLAHLDDLVMRLIEEEPGENATTTAILGATCLYAVYDPVTRRCELARAGHPPPLIITPDATATVPHLPAGPPLGLGGMPFESAELEIPEGSLIGLYTDGMIETREHDIELGMHQLAQALAQPGLSLDERCSAAVRQLLREPQSDDAALLLARPSPLTPDEVASWEVPVDPAAVATARSQATAQLARWGLDRLAPTTELIVSELVTNAIRYATGPIRVRLIRQSALICEVSDASSTSPRLKHPRTTDEGGRGLYLVAQLGRRWGTRYTPQGKIIWVEQDIPVPHTGQ